MPDSSNTDWGLKKEYLRSTRQHLGNNDYFEFLIKYVWKIDKPVRIIDFGCGYGYLAQMLMPLVPQGSTYKGIDISDALISEAQETFSGNKEVCFEVADLNEYEPTSEYDIAICQAVLRHLTKPEDIMKKMIGAVKENGQANRKIEVLNVD